MILWTSKNGSIANVLPLTNERFGDKYYYHVDLNKPFDPSNPKSTALDEHIRTVEKVRIKSPYRIRGNIARIDPEDVIRIHYGISQLYKMDLDKIMELREKEEAKKLEDLPTK